MSGAIKGTYENGTPWERHYDIDLGGGHWLSWTSVAKSYEYVSYGDTPAEARKYWRAAGNATVRIGAIIHHRSSRNSSGWCAATMRFALSPYEEAHRSEFALSYLWQFNGDFEAPTFSPSLLCSCGECHCFVQGGRWVSAGCTHGA